jgi:hypothetical protein
VSIISFLEVDSHIGYYHLRRTLSLLELAENVDCLTNLSIELCEIVQVGFDFRKRQINKHTCDLRSTLLTNELLNVFIDELTDETFDVRVLRNNSGKKTESFLVIDVNYRIRVKKRGGGTFHTSGVDHNLRGSNLLLKLLRDHLRCHRRLSNLDASRTSVVVVTTWDSLVHSIDVGTTSVVGISSLSEVRIHSRSLVEVAESLEIEEDLLDELDGIRSLEDVRIHVWLVDPLAVVEVSLVLGLSL